MYNRNRLSTHILRTSTPVYSGCSNEFSQQLEFLISI